MNKALRKITLKLLVLSLFIGLNYAGLLTVGDTASYFNDIETSEENTVSALTLDFSLASPSDFIPEVTPDQAASRTIDIIQEGILDFEYTIAVEGATGELCDHLTLTDGSSTGTPLASYTSTGHEYPAESSWEFTADLTNDDLALEGETCSFKFVFDGVQLGDCSGFSDIEEIENTITAGEWGPNIVINKVYYDVDCNHGTEPNNEWIELYNPTDTAVNLNDWFLCDNNDCNVINSGASIPALGYAIAFHGADTGDYWEIPTEMVKLNLSGTTPIELDNDADMLILKNYNGSIVDQMNWGTPTSTWPNYNGSVWDPGAVDVDEGHLLGRSPNGYDTNVAADWVDFGVPEVTKLLDSAGNPLGTYPTSHVWYSNGTYAVNWEVNNPNGDHDDLTVDFYYIIDNGTMKGSIDVNDTVYLVEEDLDFNNLPNGGQYMFHLDCDLGYCYYGYVWVRLVVTGPENPMLNSSHTSHRIFEPPNTDDEQTFGICWLDVLKALEEELGEEGADFGLGEGEDGGSADLPDDSILDTDSAEQDGTTEEPGGGEEGKEEGADDLFDINKEDDPADLPDGSITGTDTSEEDGVNND